MKILGTVLDKVSLECRTESPLLAGNDVFKVSNRNNRTMCEICSKLTIKTPERRL